MEKTRGFFMGKCGEVGDIMGKSMGKMETKPSMNDICAIAMI